MINTYSFRYAFEMMPRRPEGSDAGIHLRMSRSIPTQPTKEALECGTET